MTTGETKQLRDAWTRFDRMSALGCAQRREPYDPTRCRDAWEAYMALGETLGIPRCASPFPETPR